MSWHDPVLSTFLCAEVACLPSGEVCVGVPPPRPGGVAGGTSKWECTAFLPCGSGDSGWVCGKVLVSNRRPCRSKARFSVCRRLRSLLDSSRIFKSVEHNLCFLLSPVILHSLMLNRSSLYHVFSFSKGKKKAYTRIMNVARLITIWKTRILKGGELFRSEQFTALHLNNLADHERDMHLNNSPPFKILVSKTCKRHSRGLQSWPHRMCLYL